MRAANHPKLCVAVERALGERMRVAYGTATLSSLPLAWLTLVAEIEQGTRCQVPDGNGGPGFGKNGPSLVGNADLRHKSE